MYIYTQYIYIYIYVALHVYCTHICDATKFAFVI